MMIAASMPSLRQRDQSLDLDEDDNIMDGVLRLIRTTTDTTMTDTTTADANRNDSSWLVYGTDNRQLNIICHPMGSKKNKKNGEDMDDDNDNDIQDIVIGGNKIWEPVV